MKYETEEAVSYLTDKYPFLSRRCFVWIDTSLFRGVSEMNIIHAWHSQGTERPVLSSGANLFAQLEQTHNQHDQLLSLQNPT